MGNLYKLLPFIYLSICIGSLAIIGFPFLSGFYSKDVILELIFSRFLINSLFVYNMAIMAALFTTIYSIKLLFYVFFTNFNFNRVFIKYFTFNITENLNLMFISMSSLIILSIVSGYLFNDLFLGYGSNFFGNNSIIILNYHYNFIDIEYIHPLIKNLPFILCLTLIIILNILFIKLNDQNNMNLMKMKIFLNLQYFFYYALFFDKIYNKIYHYILYYSYLISTKYIDKGILEIVGPYGLYKQFLFLNKKINNFIEPLIFYYLFIFFFVLVILIILFFFIYIFNFDIIYNHLGIFILLNVILFYI